MLMVGLLAVQFLFGQEPIDYKIPTDSFIRTDSMIFIHLEEVDIYPQRGRKLNYRRYSRLVARLRKVYPFAVDAASELEKYNTKFENATSDRERRKYIREVERELFLKHEDELKRFTITEGRYLVLLIDRQTGNSSYSIIRELKGGVPALFWQGIAKIFNNDLKEEYDPYNRHYVIEQIVLMIEEEIAAEETDGKEK
jgi:hypothetical protein